MKKILFLLMLLPLPLWSQLIDKIEYFVDTDPGFGLGTDVPVTPATDIASLSISVNMSGLTEGGISFSSVPVMPTVNGR